MSKRFHASERMHLKKKRRRVIPLFIRTRVTLEVYDRATGELEREVGPCFNTIHDAGFDEFLKLVAGTSAQHLDAANASIKLTNTLHGGHVGVSPIIGADVGPGPGSLTKSAPTYSAKWEFHDFTTSTYDANFLELWYGDPDGVGSEYEFCHIDISAFGTKPTDKNWNFKVELELYSTDTDFNSGGLQRMMQCLTGELAAHFTGANTMLRPMSGASTEIAGSDQAADADPTVDLVNDELTWVFTVVDGVFEGTWSHSRIKHNNAGSKVNLRSGGCKTDGSSCGAKASGEEWEYTYVFSIAQGA